MINRKQVERQIAHSFQERSVSYVLYYKRQACSLFPLDIEIDPLFQSHKTPRRLNFATFFRKVASYLA